LFFNMLDQHHSLTQVASTIPFHNK
jgi:hypothetical protein